MNITFDTLKFVDALEAAKMPRDQARAIAAAVQQSHESADLITKKDLEIALAPLRNDITQIRGELVLLKWMVGAVLGGIVALMLKSFF